MNEYGYLIFAMCILDTASSLYCFENSKSEPLLLLTSLGKQNYCLRAFLEPSNAIVNTPHAYLRELKDEIQTLRKRLQVENLNSAQRENFCERLQCLRLRKEILLQNPSPDIAAQLIQQPIVPYRDAYTSQKNGTQEHYETFRT